MEHDKWIEQASISLSLLCRLMSDQSDMGRNYKLDSVKVGARNFGGCTFGTSKKNFSCIMFKKDFG